MWFTLAFLTLFIYFLTFLFLHSLIALIRTSGKMLKIGDVKRHVWIIHYMRGNIKKMFQHQFWYFCCCLVAQSCPPLCDPMDCSMQDLPVLHQLPEFAQAHVQWVSDAMQPSHPLSLCPPPALNLSQHQGLFQWVDSSQQVAKVLELQLPHQSSNEYSGLTSFRIDWFDLLSAQGTLKSLLQLHSFDISGRFILCSWSGWECAFVFLTYWVFVTHWC